MNKSRWSKMTKEQKAAYYAARKARKAAKAKAKANGAAVPVPEKKAPAKKVSAKKCAKKCGTACPCKKDPKKTVHVDGEDMSLSENAVLNAVRIATDERIAIESAISRIGYQLLKLQRAIKPNVNYIKFIVGADGNFNGYYGSSTKPAKKAPAKAK